MHVGSFYADAEKVSLVEADGTSAKWTKVFPVGVTKHRSDFGPKGITFSKDVLEAMISNYRAEGKPERAVNFFHRGATTAPGAVDEKVAAGWIQDLELRDDGLYAQIKWTERARNYITKDELRYLSPEFTMGAISKDTGKPQGPTLLGAALLNDPFLTELPRVAAAEHGVSTMDRKLVCSALGLNEDASDEQINEAAKSAALKSKDLTESNEALVLKMNTEVTKLNDQLTAVQKENAGLKAAARSVEVVAFVDGLVKVGKVAPAIRENVLKLGEAQGLEAIKFFENSVAAVQPGVELGITGDVTSSVNSKRDSAMKRLDAREAELVTKGMKPFDAFKQAQLELREEVELVFG